MIRALILSVLLCVSVSAEESKVKSDIVSYTQFRDVVLDTKISDYPGMKIDYSIPPQCEGERTYKRRSDRLFVDDVGVEKIRYAVLDGNVYAVHFKPKSIKGLLAISKILTAKFGEKSGEEASDGGMNGHMYWLRKDKLYVWKVQWRILPYIQEDYVVSLASVEAQRAVLERQ